MPNFVFVACTITEIFVFKQTDRQRDVKDAQITTLIIYKYLINNRKEILMLSSYTTLYLYLQSHDLSYFTHM